MSDIYQEEIKNCCRQLRLSANLAERAQTTSGETNHVPQETADQQDDKWCRFPKALPVFPVPR